MKKYQCLLLSTIPRYGESGSDNKTQESTFRAKRGVISFDKGQRTNFFVFEIREHGRVCKLNGTTLL